MTADFFAALGLPRSFDVDLQDLEKRYFTVQRLFHPDRLVGKSAAERQQAISRSMLTNEAYETLKVPLKRALHLLALKGITMDSVRPSTELLTDMMMQREALMEAETPQAIATLETVNNTSKTTCEKLLSQAFAAGDLPQAAEATMRLSYLVKFDHEIRIRNKTVTGLVS